MAEPSTDLGKDPLASLHKMSTTAGLGSSDYVAINTFAVLAFLLGLASFFVIPFNELLFIPIFGFLAGAVSFRQISNSNGTQGGKVLAILGLLMSLGFGGYAAAQIGMESARNSRDEKEIAGLVDSLGQSITAKEFNKAYALFGENFRSRVTEAQFGDAWTRYMSSPLFGPVKSIQWNGRVMFINDDISHERLARSIAQVKFDRVANPAPEDIIFRRVGGKWTIEEFPSLFPAEGAKKPK